MYRTSYKLEIKELDINGEIPEEQFFNIEHYDLFEDLRNSNDDISTALDDEGNTLDPIEWENCEEDLKAFSLKHPNKVFILEGCGEDYGDIWKQYFLQGKSQLEQAVITIGKFDLNKLS